MINLDTLSIISKRYKMYNDTLIKYKKIMADYKIQYEKELEKLLKEKDKIEDPVEKENFIQTHQILNNYDHYAFQIRLKERLIRQILLQVDESEEKISVNGIPYILLKHVKNDSYDLVNLKEQEVINLDELDDNTKELLVKLIRQQGSLIGSATIFDLPLLMNIIEKENFDENVRSLRMHYKCYDTRHEYQKAKMFDRRDIKTTFIDPITNEREEVESKLPFIYDSKVVEKMWYKLDEEQNILDEDEYFIKYYKYLMLFDNDIEQIYNEAPEDHKDYVIDAYFDFANGDESFDEYIQFRTASTLINTEVLKRKYAKIK